MHPETLTHMNLRNRISQSPLGSSYLAHTAAKTVSPSPRPVSTHYLLHEEPYFTDPCPRKLSILAEMGKTACSDNFTSWRGGLDFKIRLEMEIYSLASTYKK